ncbi:MAG: hypothetical protein FWB90_08165 [Fibromonadales bacterium]|nr:hypothetical protein [Fibromonadales bacterium]
MAKKTYPIATKASAKHESDVIDAEATVVKKRRKKKPVEKKAEPELTGWALKKASFGWLQGSKYTICLLVTGVEGSWKYVGYIVSTCRDIFPKRKLKKPVEIFCIPLDFDFSFFGEPCEYSGACGCINVAELPEDFELPEYIQVEAIKAEFEIIKDKLKNLSHSKFKGPKTAAIEALKLIGSLEEKLSIPPTVSSLFAK